MNAHLSEILSWLLEPLANSVNGKSSEVISDEDLKNKMDSLNKKNSKWEPEEQMPGPIGESPEMVEGLEAAPALCGCEECREQEEESVQQPTIPPGMQAAGGGADRTLPRQP